SDLVAGVDVGLHVAEARALDRGAQGVLGELSVLAQVDGAQERDVCRHAPTLGSRGDIVRADRGNPTCARCRAAATVVRRSPWSPWSPSCPARPLWSPLPGRAGPAPA